MIGWIADKWHAHQRRIDVRFLWPVCCDQTETAQAAREIFAFHAYHDRAWNRLSPEDFNTLIMALPYRKTRPCRR